MWVGVSESEYVFRKVKDFNGGQVPALSMGPVPTLSKSDLWDWSQPKGKVTYGTDPKKSFGTGPNLKRKKHLGSIPDQRK